VTVTIDVIETQPLWGTFERHREHLFDQFRIVPWVADSGLAPEDLARAVDDYLAAHPDEPRVVQKANVLRIIMTRGQIALDPLDWYADKLNHGHLVAKLNRRWLREAESTVIRQEAGWFHTAYRIGLAKGGLDTGHVSPGWENMFRGGLSGLIAQARAQREAAGDGATPEQLAFWEALEIVYSAAIALSRRFAALAYQLADRYPEHRARLVAVARVCDQVPERAPRTLHEALQFAWFMHELIEMEGERVRSAGHFDRLFLPYYTADLAAGRLTRDQAKELIKHLWFKHYARTRGRENGKNYCLGGQYRDGSEVVNELTYLALEAYEELGTPDPKLSVRFTPNTPDTLYRRVADLIRRGQSAFVLMNDVPAVEALVKRGKTVEDARAYLPIGCYEPAVDGKEVGCTMNLTLNLAKALEYALHDGRDVLSGQQIGPHTGELSTVTTFEALYDAYTTQLDTILDRCVRYIAAHEHEWPRINPSPLIAGTIDDCIARGKDIGQGGAHYNAVGCVGMGLANVVDGLLALQQAVFEEGRFTLAEVVAALDANFRGHEPMRQYLLNRVPKWGNNDPRSDALARRIADHYCAKVHTYSNARGGPCQAALFSLDYQWRLGRATAALPDGRKARESLSPGVGAMTGRDRAGVTALLQSVTQLDFTQTPNGSVLDVTLHPSAVSGEEGLAAFVALIKRFFAQGGYAIQFNVFDVATLREAQRHPERHASLQIRVTGWSVYFTALSAHEQEQFIARYAHTG
jgi:pyruvate formate-lyase/glycerol dehydratase family glycyl radical enzyme